MKRFRYRLQKVLDYREQVKKSAEGELAQKNSQLFEAETRRDAISEHHDQYPHELGDTMAEVELKNRYLQRVRDVLIQQQLFVEQAKEAVERARDVYLEKSIEAELLEKHKEQKVEEFKEEVFHDERKGIDELVVQRYRMAKKL